MSVLSVTVANLFGRTQVQALQTTINIDLHIAQTKTSKQRLTSIHHPTSTKNPHKKTPKTPSKPSTKKQTENSSKTTNRMIPHSQFDFVGFPCIHPNHLIRQCNPSRKRGVRETVNDKCGLMLDIIRLLKEKKLHSFMLSFQFGSSVILASVRSIFFDSFSSSIRVRSYRGFSSFLHGVFFASVYSRMLRHGFTLLFSRNIMVHTA